MSKRYLMVMSRLKPALAVSSRGVQAGRCSDVFRDCERLPRANKECPEADHLIVDLREDLDDEKSRLMYRTRAARKSTDTEVPFYKVVLSDLKRDNQSKLPNINPPPCVCGLSGSTSKASSFEGG